MIRQDYILRQVQELVQTLARVISLRTRGEYDAALAEIGNALRSLRETGEPVALDAESWIELCRKNEPVSGPLLNVVAGLIQEMAHIAETKDDQNSVEHLRVVALTIRLEAALTGAVVITPDLLDEIERNIGCVSVEAMPPSALRRLGHYFEQRGRFAAAEDAYFDWIDRGDPEGIAAGHAFYRRLQQMSEADLVAGGLSSSEVMDGLRQLNNRPRVG